MRVSAKSTVSMLKCLEVIVSEPNHVFPKEPQLFQSDFDADAGDIQ